MASGASKSEQPTEHDSGAGRIRERTIVLGDTLIAIDNIGSIQILDIKRNWTLARLGAVIVLAGLGAMAMPSNLYSSFGSPGPIVGMALIGFGLLLIVVNWMRPLRKGLAIGTSDGRLSYVVSKDHAFLSRLLEFLTLKINTRNEGLTTSFDITHNVFNTNGGGVVIGNEGVASDAGGHALGPSGSVSVTNNTAPPLTIAPSPPPPVSPPAPETDLPSGPGAPIDPDEALFADEPQAALAPPPLQPPAAPPKAVNAAPATRARPHDALLDGPEASADDDRDWLSAPGGIGYGAGQESGGGARWLILVLLFVVVGGGGVAGWYFYSQSQAIAVVSLIPTTSNTQPATAAEPASVALPEAAPAATESEDASAAVPVETPAAPPAITELPSAPPEVAGPQLSPETTAFTPPEVVVARASGLRYRTRPSAAEDVPIVAETLAGGETLQVNGVSKQPDGEWYRVTLPDGRAAWFKASLTVPRSRFAETFNTGASAQAVTLAAGSPRVLEPAEGIQFSGGAQPVRLAWQGPAGANVYIVEIEAYDAIARRWIETPLHKRITVNAVEEIAEVIPRTGAWRWRVRGVSADGEQSQFSRWAAFGVRD